MIKMKRVLGVIIFLFVVSFALKAQSVDSTLVGKSIFSVVASSGNVTIHQSESILNVINNHIRANAEKPIPGFRVRIFFDNTQSARTLSEEVLNRFLEMGTGYHAYRSYSSPFFKVAVGDFRTKSEALSLLHKIKNEFPASFIVKDNIRYPGINNK